MKKLILIAGPCVIEDEEMVFQIATHMKKIAETLNLNYYFKASFDKANRTSIDSFRGYGMEQGMRILERVKRELQIRIVTDIHEPWQAKPVAEIVDILQIPAFLCRQTDLLSAAAETHKAVMVKKGQFMAPWDMKSVVDKLKKAYCDKIILCERGTSFGYNRLVVDMAGLSEMRKYGCPVIFDATHSVQLPGGLGTSTGGNRELIPTLVRAATAVGVDGLFMEVHPNPDQALSDGPNMIPLDRVEDLLRDVIAIKSAVDKQE